MIDTGSIMNKLRHFAGTAAGKERIKNVVSGYRKTGKTLSGGRKIAGLEDMKDLADTLALIIHKHLPDSISSVGQTLSSSQPTELPDGSYEVVVVFDSGAIRRVSLWPEGYPEGIDNIVALLNNGYNARDYAYGVWDNHRPRGEALWDVRNSPGDSNVYIRGVKDREALRFMQDAVREFNTLYGQKYNVTAVLGSEYTRAY